MASLQTHPLQRAQVDGPNGVVQLQYQWIARERSDAPLMVFLHEGLGSIAMWKDFPETLCDALQCRGLVYSRYGYGASSPRPHGERWPIDYLTREAHALAHLLATLGIDTRLDRPVLFGHSDGGSIALLYAALYPAAVAGVIAIAPHISVEPASQEAIRKAGVRYREDGLRQQLARYHDDVDSAFGAWHDTWLQPGFETWNIEAALSAIVCPVLAIQGRQDEYASLDQIEGVQRAAPHTQLAVIESCGHSPHKEQPGAVLELTTQFVAALGRQAAGLLPPAKPCD